MKKLFFLIILLAATSLLSAQKVKHGIEYKFNIEAVKQSPSIIWYGWDFSHSKMRDFKKFQEGELILGRHMPAILALMEKKYSKKDITRSTKKDSVMVDMLSIQDLYQTIDAKKFIVPRIMEIQVDDIKSIVKSYSLPQKEGLGMVVIIEMMNSEDDRYVSGYITYFDVATREVYYTTKMKGIPGSKWGFDDYWFNGLTEIFDYFFAYYYNKIYK